VAYDVFKENAAGVLIGLCNPMVGADFAPASFDHLPVMNAVDGASGLPQRPCSAISSEDLRRHFPAAMHPRKIRGS